MLLKIELYTVFIKLFLKFTFSFHHGHHQVAIEKLVTTASFEKQNCESNHIKDSGRR